MVTGLSRDGPWVWVDPEFVRIDQSNQMSGGPLDGAETTG